MFRSHSSGLGTHLPIQVNGCLQAVGKDGWGKAIVDACVLIIALGSQLIRGRLCTPLHIYTFRQLYSSHMWSQSASTGTELRTSGFGHARLQQ